MRKPLNKNFGLCVCPFCQGDAHVRRLKDHDRGKLFLSCPKCGTIRPERAHFQAWVTEHMRALDAEPAPAPKPAEPAPVDAGPAPAPAVETPKPAPEKPVQPAPAPAAPAPAPKQKPGGFFDRVGNCL